MPAPPAPAPEGGRPRPRSMAAAVRPACAARRRLMGPRPDGRGRDMLSDRRRPVPDASMGPRLDSRGRVAQVWVEPVAVVTSMGPRPCGRGRGNANDIASSDELASMGPRPCGRGRAAPVSLPPPGAPAVMCLSAAEGADGRPAPRSCGTSAPRARALCAIQGGSAGGRPHAPPRAGRPRPCLAASRAAAKRIMRATCAGMSARCGGAGGGGRQLSAARAIAMFLAHIAREGPGPLRYLRRRPGRPPPRAE